MVFAAIVAAKAVAEVRLEAGQVVLKCLEEVACECLEKVVEDVDDGRTELLGLEVTQ